MGAAVSKADFSKLFAEWRGEIKAELAVARNAFAAATAEQTAAEEAADIARASYRDLNHAIGQTYRLPSPLALRLNNRLTDMEKIKGRVAQAKGAVAVASERVKELELSLEILAGLLTPPAPAEATE